MADRSNSTSASSNKSTVGADPTAQESLRDDFNTMQSDIYRARCMALYLCETLDQALYGGMTRADDPDWGLIDKQTRDLIDFGSNNVLERLLAMEKGFGDLFDRFIDRHDSATEARADAAWQAVEREAAPKGDTVSPLAGRDAVHDLECAVSAIAGLIDAINELAGGTANPEPRLSGIFAVCGALADELRAADEAVGVLRRAKRSKTREAA